MDMFFTKPPYLAAMREFTVNCEVMGHGRNNCPEEEKEEAMSL